MNRIPVKFGELKVGDTFFARELSKSPRVKSKRRTGHFADGNLSLLTFSKDTIVYIDAPAQPCPRCAELVKVLNEIRETIPEQRRHLPLIDEILNITEAALKGAGQ